MKKNKHLHIHIYIGTFTLAVQLVTVEKVSQSILSHTCAYNDTCRVTHKHSNCVLELITYSPSEHVIHECAKTPPVYCFAMSNPLQYLRSPETNLYNYDEHCITVQMCTYLLWTLEAVRVYQCYRLYHWHVLVHKCHSRVVSTTFHKKRSIQTTRIHCTCGIQMPFTCKTKLEWSSRWGGMNQTKTDRDILWEEMSNLSWNWKPTLITCPAHAL